MIPNKLLYVYLYKILVPYFLPAHPHRFPLLFAAVMSMASMVQSLCTAPNEPFEGSSSAAFFSSQLAFDCSAPNLFVHSGGANAISWDQPCTKNCCSPGPMEGPVTPAGPFINSANADPADDHDFSFMDTIAKNISYLDLLSFNTSHISADLDMDLPLQEEMLLGLHRNLSVYGGVYADMKSGMAAAAGDDRSESLMQSCSYVGDDVKLSRSLTFPPAARPCSTSSSGAARSPLLLSGSDGQINHTINHGRYSSNRNTCREISNRAATTSCTSAEHPDGQREAKVVQIKAEASEMTHCQDQQECSQYIGTTKGLKKSKKRVAIAGNCLTSVKAPRVDTPPDVVHVRARRGQATDSHSLAERVRREKISQRMKVLQEIVPGCHKVLGKAMMLDEIINYVKSLQRQVEFLSMKLAAANQAGMASMITEKVNFLSSNVGFLGDLSTSQIQFLQLEPLIASLMQ